MPRTRGENAYKTIFLTTIPWVSAVVTSDYLDLDKCYYYYDS